MNRIICMSYYNIQTNGLAQSSWLSLILTILLSTTRILLRLHMLHCGPVSTLKATYCNFTKGSELSSREKVPTSLLMLSIG